MFSWLFSQLASSKQVVAVFSATYPDQLDQFLSQYMTSLTMVQTDSADVQLMGAKQYLAVCQPVYCVICAMPCDVRLRSKNLVK